MLMILQLRYSVGEPEHGGRLHVQPCLVRVWKSVPLCSVPFPRVSTFYWHMSCLFTPISRAFTCLCLPSLVTPQFLTFTCKIDHNTLARYLGPIVVANVFRCPRGSLRIHAYQRPSTYHPATHQREQRTNNTRSNSTAKPRRTPLPVPPWTTATPLPPLPPPTQPSTTLTLPSSLSSSSSPPPKQLPSAPSRWRKTVPTRQSSTRRPFASYASKSATQKPEACRRRPAPPMRVSFCRSQMAAACTRRFLC
jgi:hypothetical protein